VTGQYPGRKTPEELGYDMRRWVLYSSIWAQNSTFPESQGTTHSMGFVGNAALFALIGLVYTAQGRLVGQTADEVCNQTGNWANCGVAVKRELQTKAPDSKRATDLAGLWGRAYADRYNSLRKAAHLERATPDAEKLFEAVNSHLNPVDIAKDKVEDLVLKRYLSWAATLAEWAEKPLSQALKAFFDSSETATDYDELRLMNDDLQKRIIIILEEHMQPGWKDKLDRAVTDALPELRRP